MGAYADYLDERPEFLRGLVKRLGAVTVPPRPTPTCVPAGHAASRSAPSARLAPRRGDRGLPRGK